MEVTANRTYAGWRIDHIEKSLETGQWQVRFDNGHTLVQGRALGHDQEGIFRLQLRWLIQRHFEKKARLTPLGIKCLSLVFIDKVANYLASEASELPLIKRLFEEEYTIKLQAITGQAPDAQQLQAAQGSYFAQTGQGAYTDSENSMSKNSAIYKRILTDKAGLLQLSDPVEFIFSHSALGVGWDNPNVFNIATLNATQSNDRKRQELGRGLRICVNQQGQRVYDTPGTPLGKEINLLTVVPNMSYEAFAQAYQEEIEEAYGTEANAGATLRENRAGKPQKKTLRRRQDLFDSQAFKQFWNSMARTTRYSVGFDEDAIVHEVVPKLQKISVPIYSADITANFTEGQQAYWEQTGVTQDGVKMSTNTKSDGRFHSNWLNMIYPRLLVARQLLREDGVIFVSIDDNEVTHLRKVMDEVFGEENFFAFLTRRAMHTVRNTSKDFNKHSDYVLVYAFNKTWFEADPSRYIRVLRDKTDNYPFDDSDGRGVYKTDPLSARNYMKPYVYTFKNGVVWQAPEGS
jgi:restriction endonuclease